MGANNAKLQSVITTAIDTDDISLLKRALTDGDNKKFASEFELYDKAALPTGELTEEALLALDLDTPAPVQLIASRKNSSAVVESRKNSEAMEMPIDVGIEVKSPSKKKKKKKKTKARVAEIDGHDLRVAPVHDGDYGFDPVMSQPPDDTESVASLKSLNIYDDTPAEDVKANPDAVVTENLSEKINQVKLKGNILLLHYAAKVNKPTSIKFIVENGADVDIRDQNGWTALHYAAASRANHAIEMLLRLGASCHVFSHDLGLTPAQCTVDMKIRQRLQDAASSTHGLFYSLQIVKTLVSKGSHISVTYTCPDGHDESDYIQLLYVPDAKQEWLHNRIRMGSKWKVQGNRGCIDIDTSLLSPGAYRFSYMANPVDLAACDQILAAMKKHPTLPMGTRCNTPQGPGTIMQYRAQDEMYVVNLDWKLANGANVYSYVSSLEIPRELDRIQPYSVGHYTKRKYIGAAATGLCLIVPPEIHEAVRNDAYLSSTPALNTKATAARRKSEQTALAYLNHLAEPEDLFTDDQDYEYEEYTPEDDLTEGGGGKVAKEVWPDEIMTTETTNTTASVSDAPGIN